MAQAVVHESPTDPRSTGRAPASPALVVAVLSSVGLIASLCMTLVVPIVPQLPALLHTTTADASWVITATLLGGAVATPIAGRLGDMVGKRKVLLATLALLVLGALICALTTSLLPVIIGRSLQGVAVSAVPLGISLMRDALPPERLGSGIALMSATLGIGGGLGLPLSALIVQVADWHALFWVAGALGVAGIAVILLVIPESPQRSGGRFDAVGAVGLTVGLVLGLLAISKGGTWGWGSATTIGSAVGAVVVLLAWGAWELRTADPIVDLRISARRAVLVPNLVSVPVGVAMFTGMITFPQLLQAPMSSGYGLGLSLIMAGPRARPQRHRHDADVPGDRAGLGAVRPADLAAGRARDHRHRLRARDDAALAGLARRAGHLAGRRRGRAGLRLAPRPDHARRPDRPDRRGQRAEHPDALGRHVDRLRGGGRRALGDDDPRRRRRAALPGRPAHDAADRGRGGTGRPRRDRRDPGAPALALGRRHRGRHRAPRGHRRRRATLGGPRPRPAGPRRARPGRPRHPRRPARPPARGGPGGRRTGPSARPSTTRRRCS